MRTETEIKAGIDEAEKLITEQHGAMDKAIFEKDFVKIYQLACDILAASLAHIAVTDACFGDEPKQYTTTKEETFIFSTSNKQFY